MSDSFPAGIGTVFRFAPPHRSGMWTAFLADTRMVETTYAITRHEGIMKHKDLINTINPYACGSAVAPEEPSSPQYIRVLENALAPSWHQEAKNG